MSADAHLCWWTTRCRRPLVPLHLTHMCPRAAGDPWPSSTEGAASPGALTSLVADLQADVDKLQRQLSSSRRQLTWETTRKQAGNGR
jgi:hypothetical protein